MDPTLSMTWEANIISYLDALSASLTLLQSAYPSSICMQLLRASNKQNDRSREVPSDKRWCHTNTGLARLLRSPVAAARHHSGTLVSFRSVSLRVEVLRPARSNLDSKLSRSTLCVFRSSPIDRNFTSVQLDARGSVWSLPPG